MGKIANWITKIPRLKNSKVARFSYKAEAYANDDIEGVDSYDYSNDMNVPLATHTDFDGSVLSTGARANFSSIPKNGLNHFFGRVSYNLNKVIDFLSDFLDDFIALNDSFISFTEIVSFSSSATLSNYANGSTKRLLNTAGSNITITLPAGETYLGSNTITLAPSIMLTITKRGTVWVNSSGTAITALTADKWKTARNVTISDADGTNTGTAVSVDGSENETLKLPSTIKATLSGKSKDSYPIPTDAVLQYSFDEIKQLPDNPTGTVYKRDNDWTTTDGWTATSGSVSVVNNSLELVSTSTSSAGVYKSLSSSQETVIVKVKRSNAGRIRVSATIDGILAELKTATVQAEKDTIIMSFISGTYTDIRVYMLDNIGVDTKLTITSVYIGDGSYLEPVIDNSYSESHAENHGVIPVDGVCGKAGYFNNSYMIAPRPALGDDITIYFWVKFDASISGSTICSSRMSMAETGLVCYFSGSSQKYALNYGGVSTTFNQLLVNGWHHVTMKCNDTTKVLKINGVLADTVTGTFTTHTNYDTTILFGKDNFVTFTRQFSMDGFKIVPRFTTDDEDIGEYKARANLPKFYATADKWKTARTIAISDADGTNTGTAVSVDGSENETLKLPPTIKANLTGNASTATIATQANVRVSLRHGSSFFAKTWTGLTTFNGGYIWTDGENIYYSFDSVNYVLNKATSTWSVKTWTGLTNINCYYIWTDGENIYYSFDSENYVLNKATSTWSVKTWTGLTNFTGSRVWTDGENIYYSFDSENYVLNKATSTWSVKTWTGLTNFNGGYTWTDGENIYYNFESANYVLNKATSTWSVKTWTGLTNFNGFHIWTDGENIYYNLESANYVLNKATSTWSKTWTGLGSLYGNNTWTDGENIYYSFESTHLVLPATRHNYVDDTKYNSLFGTVTDCSCKTLSDRFVFRNE